MKNQPYVSIELIVASVEGLRIHLDLLDLVVHLDLSLIHIYRDEMLLAGMNTGLLQPVIATKIINDDNNGSVISTENPYQDYVQTFKSIAHAVGCDLNVKEKITSSYTNAEIEAYIKELNEEFGLDSVAPVSYTHLDVYKRQV